VIVTLVYGTSRPPNRSFWRFLPNSDLATELSFDGVSRYMEVPEWR
jgi:hypothetical protein